MTPNYIKTNVTAKLVKNLKINRGKLLDNKQLFLSM